MPSPIPDAQWAINLGTIAAGAVAALGAWTWKRFEQRRPEREQPGLAIVGGALIDNRLIERLCDQLGHNERATRDAERATIDNTGEIERSTRLMGDVRRALDERNRAMSSGDAAMLDALARASKAAGGSSQ